VSGGALALAEGPIVRPEASGIPSASAPYDVKAQIDKRAEEHDANAAAKIPTGLSDPRAHRTKVCRCRQIFVNADADSLFTLCVRSDQRKTCWFLGLLPPIKRGL
jgi:hypothetical protein